MKNKKALATMISRVRVMVILSTLLCYLLKFDSTLNRYLFCSRKTNALKEYNI